MRLISFFITLVCLGGGSFYLFDKYPHLKEKAEELLDFRTVQVFQVHYEEDQIIESNQKVLLKGKGARVMRSELAFYPLLFLEVKYPLKKRTKEGVMLWDLSDGEMVLSTKTWEKTHGFGDCISGGAHRTEFRILQLLVEKGGGLEKEGIAQKLGLELAVVDMALRSCEKKQFVIGWGENKYRMHLERPKFTSNPETKICTQLALATQKKASALPQIFTPYQIKRGAHMIFGEHFSIRNARVVHLPVYKVFVQDIEGAISNFYFNGLTGKEMPSSPFYN